MLCGLKKLSLGRSCIVWNDAQIFTFLLHWYVNVALEWSYNKQYFWPIKYNKILHFIAARETKTNSSFPKFQINRY